MTSYFIVFLPFPAPPCSDSSSVTEAFKTRAIFNSIWTSGTERPFSHLETVCLTTHSLTASSSWERPLPLRNLTRFLLNIWLLLLSACHYKTNSSTAQATGINICIPAAGHPESLRHPATPDPACRRSGLKSPVSSRRSSPESP